MEGGEITGEREKGRDRTRARRQKVNEEGKDGKREGKGERWVKGKKTKSKRRRGSGGYKRKGKERWDKGKKTEGKGGRGWG